MSRTQCMHSRLQKRVRPPMQAQSREPAAIAQFSFGVHTLLLAPLLVLGVVAQAQLASAVTNQNVAIRAGFDGEVLVDGLMAVHEELASVDVELYIKADHGTPSATDEVCSEGAAGANGDETCGFDLSLVSTGDIKLLGFVPDSVAYEYKITGSQQQMKINGMNLSNLKRDPAIMRLGILTMDTRGASDAGTLRLITGKRVSADLTLQPVQGHDIATLVPEPSQLWLILAGVAGLVCLRRQGRG
jgi:hypothetical protein